jgi:hypothetical protein
MVTGVQKSVQSVTETVSTVQKSVEGFGARLEEVDKVAKAAGDSVKGVVFAAPLADNEGSNVRKSAVDNDPRTGQFDTAFITKRNSR